MPNREIFLILFLLFIVLRLRWNSSWTSRERIGYHQKRELTTTTIFTLILIGIYVGWLSSGVFYFADIWLPQIVQYCGLFISGCGLLLLHFVHYHLGQNFSPHLEIAEEHTLTQSGPYKYIRHPMYTSGFLYLFGAGLLASNWIVLVLPLFAFAILVNLRIADEEKMLSAKFGDRWQEYHERTGRFFFAFKAK